MGRSAGPEGFWKDARANGCGQRVIGSEAGGEAGEAGGSEDVGSRPAAGEAPLLGVVGVKAWR